MSKPDTVLVWGPLGFIGRHLVEKLLLEGKPVRALSRKRQKYSLPPWANEVEWFELSGDSDRDQSVFQNAIKDVATVYNLSGSSGAAQSNAYPAHSLETNCRSQLDFIEACRTHGSCPHVVFTSSRLVYGKTDRVSVSEAHPTFPLSVYAAHKLCIENYLQIFCRHDVLNFTICRISNVYGFDGSTSGHGYKIINQFIQNGIHGKPITLFGDGEQLRDLIYIDDLVEGLWLCGTHPDAVNQVFNIGYGESYPMINAARLIQKLTGTSEISFLPWPQEFKLVEPGDYIGNISKAKSTLGFSARHDFETGIRKTIENYR